MADLTALELTALITAEQAATPGPWKRRFDGAGPDDLLLINGDGCFVNLLHEDNWTFVVAARNALPRLLSEIESARVELAQLRGERGFWGGSGLLDRLATIADEAFGPFPVQTPDENLSAIERGISNDHVTIERMRRVVEAAVAVVPEDLEDGPDWDEETWLKLGDAVDAFRAGKP